MDVPDYNLLTHGEISVAIAALNEFAQRHIGRDHSTYRILSSIVTKLRAQPKLDDLPPVSQPPARKRRINTTLDK